MGSPHITIRTRIARQVLLRHKQHRLAVVVTVIDNGPGVPAELQDRIFHPLVTGREGGTGLGLSLAQDFMQQHGGVIEFDSRPGHTDIVTRSFSNAKDVSYALKEETPAALISDIRMPGMDGLTLLKEIKEKYPSLPVIIMTAFSDLNSTVAAFQGGAFDYLAKPFDINDAVNLISRAVNEGREQADDAQEVVESGQVSDKGMLTQSASVSMQEVFRAIGRLAQSNVTVARALGVAPKRLSDAALKALYSFDYPGNVRQLENFCHWLTVMAPGQTIESEDLPPEIRAAGLPVNQLSPTAAVAASPMTWQELLAIDATERLSRSEGDIWSTLTDQFERTLLQSSLEVCRGRRVEAASRLGMGRNTITRKLRELGLDPVDDATESGA
eukprot:gene4552-4597_t